MMASGQRTRDMVCGIDFVSWYLHSLEDLPPPTSPSQRAPSHWLTPSPLHAFVIETMPLIRILCVDLRHSGRGVVTYAAPDGTIAEKYDGEWLEGYMHGVGKYFYADGGVYDGEWQSGQVCAFCGPRTNTLF